VVCGATVCWCGSAEEDENKSKWEVMRKMIMKEVGNPEQYIVRLKSKWNE
jgi:hypothetical protein